MPVRSKIQKSEDLVEKSLDDSINYSFLSAISIHIGTKFDIDPTKIAESIDKFMKEHKHDLQPKTKETVEFSMKKLKNIEDDDSVVSTISETSESEEKDNGCQFVSTRGRNANQKCNSEKVENSIYCKTHKKKTEKDTVEKVEQKVKTEVKSTCKFIPLRGKKAKQICGELTENNGDYCKKHLKSVESRSENSKGTDSTEVSENTSITIEPEQKKVEVAGAIATESKKEKKDKKKKDEITVTKPKKEKKDKKDEVTVSEPEQMKEVTGAIATESKKEKKDKKKKEKVTVATETIEPEQKKETTIAEPEQKKVETAVVTEVSTVTEVENCTFIYKRKNGDYNKGDQCKEKVKEDKLCEKHLKIKKSVEDVKSETEKVEVEVETVVVPVPTQSEKIEVYKLKSGESYFLIKNTQFVVKSETDHTVIGKLKYGKFKDILINIERDAITKLGFKISELVK